MNNRDCIRNKGLFPAILALIAAFGGCVSYTPQWTPQNTQPPTALPALPASALLPEIPEIAPAEENTPALTLDTALRTAFERNRELEVRQYSPDIVRQAIAEARAAFDPAVTGTAQYEEQNRPGTTMDTGITGGAASTGNATIDEAIDALGALVETTQAIQDLAHVNDTRINKTEGFGSSVQIVQPLPTGTAISATGNYQRSAMTGVDSEYTGTWDIAVTQSLLRGFGPDVNLVALRQARNDAAIGELAFRDHALTLAENVENAYWTLALAQETHRIRLFSRDLAEEQLKLNEAYITVGKLSGSDRVSAEAEVAAQKAALVDAQADLYDKAIDLWKLMNPDAQTPADIRMSAVPLPDVEEIAVSMENSLALAIQFRPDLAQAHLDVENGTLSVIQTKNGLLPQLDAFASYGTYSNGATPGAWNDYLDDATYDQFSAGLSFSMTLGRRAEKARYRRAVFQEDQARAAVRNLEQTIETEVRKAIVEVERQRAQIAASQHEMAMREKELAVETERFRLGRSTNLDVMQVRRDFIQAKVNEATARVRYLQAVAALYGTEGTLLTRRGVALENSEENVR